MCFTVFSVYPAFAVILGLYIFLSKNSTDFSLIFGSVLSKIDEKVVPGAHPQHNWFVGWIFYFFRRFWDPLAPPGGHICFKQM